MNELAAKTSSGPGGDDEIVPSQTGDDIVELTASLAAISRQFNQATVRNDTLQKQIEGLLGKQRNLQSSCDAAQGEVEKVRDENSELKEQLHFAETRIEIQAACINELQLKIRALSEEQTRLNNLLPTAEKVEAVKHTNVARAQSGPSTARDEQLISVPPKLSVLPVDKTPNHILPTPVEDVAHKSKEVEASTHSQAPIPQHQNISVDDTGEDALVRWQDVIRMHHPGALSNLKKPQRDRVMADIQEWHKQYLSPEVAAKCIYGVTRKKRQNFRTRGSATKRPKTVADVPSCVETSSDAPGEPEEDETYVRDLAIPRRFAEQVMLFIESKFIEGRYTTVTLRRDRRQPGASPVLNRSPEKSPEMPSSASQLSTALCSPPAQSASITTSDSLESKEGALVHSERSFKLPVTVQIPNKPTQVEELTGENVQQREMRGQERVSQHSIISVGKLHGSSRPQNHNEESDEDQLWPSEEEDGPNHHNAVNVTKFRTSASPAKRKRLDSTSSAESTSPVRLTQKSRRVVRVIRESEECTEENEIRRDGLEPIRPSEVDTDFSAKSVDPTEPTRSSPRRNVRMGTFSEPMIVDNSTSAPSPATLVHVSSEEDKIIKMVESEDVDAAEEGDDIADGGNTATAEDPLLSFVDDMMMLSPSLAPTPANGIAEPVGLSLNSEAANAPVLASESESPSAHVEAVESNNATIQPSVSPQKFKVSSGGKVALSIEKMGVSTKGDTRRKSIKGTSGIVNNELVDASGRTSSSESADGPVNVRNSPAALSAENHSATRLPPLTLPKFKKRPIFPAPTGSTGDVASNTTQHTQTQSDQGNVPAPSIATVATTVTSAIDLRGPRVPYMTVIDTIIPNHRSLNKKWQGKIRFHVKAWLSEKVGADRFVSVCKLDVNDGKDWTYGVPRSLVQDFRTWFQEQNFLERYAAYLKAAPAPAGDGKQQQKSQRLQQQQIPGTGSTSGRQIGNTSPPRATPVGYIASPYPANTIQYTSAPPAYSSLPPGTIPAGARVNHFQISNGNVFAAYPQYVWPAQPTYPPPPY
ncbi:hypothetical protein BJ742DRAFT_811134 [Cladochytrium replicatum]|nr:hypothetical protein BJ742DRAFT_811134 [Cladochytrium replicatum]